MLIPRSTKGEVSGNKPEQMRGHILIFFLSLLYLNAFAQADQYNFSRLNIYSGLSHNHVTAILKDADGFMWFGTMAGLNRYDGYSCKVFRKRYNDSTSLRDNNISGLYEAPGGKIFIKTAGGPCIYNPAREQFDDDIDAFLKGLALPAGTISSITKGREGRYWIVYENGELCFYKEKENAAPERGRFGAGDGEMATAVAETRDGKLWVVLQNGILRLYAIASGKLLFQSDALKENNPGTHFYRVFEDRDGNLWLWAINSGALLFQPGLNRITLFNERSATGKLNTDLVTQIVEDEHGMIWVATDHGGVNLINKKNGFRVSYLLNDPKDPRSLSQNSITAMYKDDRGGIWLGTYKQGVSYLNSSVALFPLFRRQEFNRNSLPYDDVNRFVEDRDGNLWIGTNGGGLIFFDRKQNTFKQYLHDPSNPNSLNNNVVVSLIMDHKGVLWVGTYFGGLSSFDGKKFTHYRHREGDATSLSNDNVWELFEDREYNLWVGTLGGGVDLLDRQSGKFTHVDYETDQALAIPAHYVSCIRQDKAGRMWIGTSGGVIVLNKDFSVAATYQTSTKKENSLSNNNITCILEDKAGNTWLGTREGLNILDPKTNTFRVLTTANGLPDNMILDVLEDNAGTIWVSTPNGLCNLLREKNSAGQDFTAVNYDESNNLQNREFNENAALKTARGELIFGGPSGFNIIDPGKIRKQEHRPDIVLTGFQLLGRNVSPGENVDGRVLLPNALSHLENIALKYKENVFSIEFTSLDFRQGAIDKYAYKMEGFNADWIYVSGDQRRATYTNLSPGSYLFKVKVLNRDGAWSPEKTLKIKILPPFWRTTAAYIVYLLMAAGLFWLARRIILERIHMRYEVQQKRREAIRAQAVEQLKTKFFTNVSHEFRTPLSLIISPLDKIIRQTTNEEQKKQLSLVQRNAKRLLNLVNQLLDFRKMEVQEIKLHPAIGDIIAFTKDISDSFLDIAEKKNMAFSFQSNTDHLEIYFDKDKIEKILFNLLSNAFKYTSENGSVNLALHYHPPAGEASEGSLAIEVSDTGIGIPADKQEKIFERFFQTDVPETMVNQGTGIGLAITKEFVKLHQGVISVKSAPDKGTTFTVLIPAKKIYDAAVKTSSVSVLEEDAGKLFSEEGAGNGRKKIVLVVEDNEDIRFYLKENLKATYEVEEATNGKEGFEKARALMPDLVVSDVMMPLMDGIEMSAKLKSETLTAHIPIILLTAMGSEEKQLEGLKVGVNDYVTKPFTFEILASRIRNLIAQQKLLQKRFQKQLEVNPGEVTITPVDEKFLRQALELVEQHMDNADFSVEDFSRDMFMNRVTLYRKILSLTGKTPIEFIRSIRMKRAAQLLLKSGMSVSEVAYEVGFNNPKHFAKAFKEEFKVLPSKYASSQKGEAR